MNSERATEKILDRPACSTICREGPSIIGSRNCDGHRRLGWDTSMHVIDVKTFREIPYDASASL